MTHEVAFFAAFVLPDRKQRCPELLGNKRTEPKRQTIPNTPRSLTESGAPSTCRAMSTNSRIDGLELALADALAEVVGGGCGTLISCK